MGHGHHHAHPPPPMKARGISPEAARERQREAEKATWVSVWVNLLLTVLQLAVGWLAHSQSLMAHGVHSFSDLLSDFLVIVASRQSVHPADPEHPYGHARLETAATLVLGVALVGIGGAFLWDSAERLQHLESMPAIAWPAFWIALATVLAKEVLYRYLVQVAERLRSQLLVANALHTRADAASALVVVVGVGGALMGWSFLDSLAAALMGYLILHMGASLAWGALKELVDTGLDSQQVAAITATLEATPGVLGVHDLRTRRMGQQALVDAHVQVSPRISVSEGHRIAELARQALLDQHSEVLDVLVHIDPESDLESALGTASLPERSALLADLAPLLQSLPPADEIVLHYLGGQVEVEIILPWAVFADSQALALAHAALTNGGKDYPQLRALTVACRIAPH